MLSPDKKRRKRIKLAIVRLTPWIIADTNNNDGVALSCNGRKDFLSQPNKLPELSNGTLSTETSHRLSNSTRGELPKNKNDLGSILDSEEFEINWVVPTAYDGLIQEFGEESSYYRILSVVGKIAEKWNQWIDNDNETDDPFSRFYTAEVTKTTIVEPWPCLNGYKGKEAEQEFIDLSNDLDEPECKQPAVVPFFEDELQIGYDFVITDADKIDKPEKSKAILLHDKSEKIIEPSEWRTEEMNIDDGDSTGTEIDENAETVVENDLNKSNIYAQDPEIMTPRILEKVTTVTPSLEPKEKYIDQKLCQVMEFMDLTLENEKVDVINLEEDEEVDVVVLEDDQDVDIIGLEEDEEVDVVNFEEHEIADAVCVNQQASDRERPCIELPPDRNKVNLWCDNRIELVDLTRDDDSNYCELVDLTEHDEVLCFPLESIFIN